MATAASPKPQVVITGMGVVSAVGVGIDAFWASLQTGRSGVGAIRSFDANVLPIRIAAEVSDFDPKQYVRPRKSLKVMARDMQFAVAGADMAAGQAGFEAGAYDPARVGVVLGADRIRNDLGEIADAYRLATVGGEFDYDVWSGEGIWEGYPLVFLKNLPNMSACHISIAHDARGPNNTIQMADASSLLAVQEAARLIERGAADAMFSGGTSSRMHPLDWARSCISESLSHRNGETPAAPRPFDCDRDGEVRGEGAAIFLLESRTRAEARGAPILAEVRGCGSAFAPGADSGEPGQLAIARAAAMALKDADLAASDLGHVNAHGTATLDGDIREARALASSVPDIPVTALKSYFGNVLAAAGAVEMAGSILALEHGYVPQTLNHERRDPLCPIPIVHSEPLIDARPRALLVNETRQGQAVAITLSRPE